ncbi:hypothetical protein [Nocardia sp. NPDC051750]|uniref:hypothetical protein n=1 Tax=Nocardia sp. NPDC051750 TaxID=3364325 RepID=UPI0037888702
MNDNQPFTEGQPDPQGPARPIVNGDILVSELIATDAWEKIPTITDPAEAQALLYALLEALENGRFYGVQAEFSAGAVWDRKESEEGGDISPIVTPSTYRSTIGDDDLYLSVSVRIKDSDTLPAVVEFADRLRKRSERDLLEHLEAAKDRRREALNAEQEELRALDSQIKELRRRQ